VAPGKRAGKTGGCPGAKWVKTRKKKLQTCLYLVRKPVAMMGKRMKQTCNEQILINAFRTFDPEGRGYIPRKELSDILTSYGDRLTQQELAELLNVTENENQQVKYDLFVNLMFAKK
jgi:Ca2+-binding EF-hand superfamily protein